MNPGSAIHLDLSRNFLKIIHEKAVQFHPLIFSDSWDRSSNAALRFGLGCDY